MARQNKHNGPAARSRGALQVGFTFGEDCFHSLPIGLVVLCLENPDDPRSFRISDVNLAATVVLGIPVERLRSKPLDDFPNVFQAGWRDRLLEVIQTQRSLDLGQVEYEDERASRRVYHLQAFPLAENCVGLAFDGITQRLRAVPATRESNERTGWVIETAQEAFIAMDGEGRITDWNPEAERIFGWSRTEAVGRRLADTIVPAQHREAHKRGLQHFLMTGEGPLLNKRTEMTALHRDGHEFPVELTITATRLESTYVFNSFLHDITERRRGEEVLRESEERFRLLVEGVKEYAIFTLDPQGHVYTWNAGAEQIKGYTAADILGKHFSVFYTPEDIRAGKPECLLERARREGQANDEGWRVRKDGSRFWASVSVTGLYDERGQLRRFAEVTRDMTERREREEDLRSSKQQLQIMFEGRTAQLIKVNTELREEIHRHMETEARLRESLEQLRNLAARVQNVREGERASVAREIHDELGQACTALKMDLSVIIRKLPRSQSRVMTKARSSMQLVDGMIRTIRQIASELRPSTLDDLGLTAAVEWQVQEFQTRTGIACRLKLPGEALDLDAERSTALFRILQETLTNVTRHAEATSVDVRLVKTETELLLEIRDNGKGFDMKLVLPRQSFGLLGMHERALVLGGVFSVNSRPGEGTTVKVKIPVGLRCSPGSNS